MKKITIPLLVLFLLFLCGCGDNEIEKSEIYNKFSQSESVCVGSEDSTYQTIEILGTNSEGMCLLEFDTREVGTEDMHNEDHFLFLRADGKREYIDEDIFQSRGELYGCTSQDGNTYVYAFGDSSIRLYDASCSSVKEIYLKDSGLKQTSAYENVAFSISGIQCDNENVYVADEEGGLWVLSNDLEFQLHVPGPKNNDDFIVWRFLPNIYGRTVLYPGYGRKLFEYKDGELHKFGKSLQRKMADMLISSEIVAGDDEYDFYLRAVIDDVSGEEHLLGVKDGKVFDILNESDLGFSQRALYQIVNFGNREFGFSDWNSEYQMLYYLKYDENTSVASRADKKEMVLAGINIPYEVKCLVMDFNYSSPDYHITFKDYNIDEAGYEEASSKLKLDLINGSKIDGILLYGIDRIDFSENGILEDMAPFINSSEVFDEKVWIKSARNALYDENGSVYSVYPEYTVAGFMTADKVDISDPNALRQYAGDREVFAEQYTEAILPNIINYSESSIVDEQKQYITVESDQFTDMLKLIKEQVDNERIASEISGQQRIAEEKAAVLYERIAFPYEYLFYQTIFDGPFYCSNYGIDAPVIVPGNAELGVVSTSENKDGMHEFIEFVFTDENYSKYFGKMAMPVLQSSYDDWIKRMTTDGEYIDHLGNTLPGGFMSIGFENFSLNLGTATDEQIEEMNAFFDSARRAEPMKTKYVSIINEEGRNYIFNNVELNSAIFNMSNRLKTAVGEED